MKAAMVGVCLCPCNSRPITEISLRHVAVGSPCSAYIRVVSVSPEHYEVYRSGASHSLLSVTGLISTFCEVVWYPWLS